MKHLNKPMESENLTELSDQELLQKIKKIQTNKIIDATFIGFTIGIVIYSAVENGFGFFTFFPLILAYLIARNSTNNKILEKEMQKELKSRHLK
ncbi:MAG: FUSC family protein [Bacteroidales bacterium]|nr:FUSC family protein [Bacteroidales bacterium]